MKKIKWQNVLLFILILTLVYSLYLYFAVTKEYIAAVVIYAVLLTGAIIAYGIINDGFKIKYCDPKTEEDVKSNKKLEKTRILLYLIFAFIITFVLDVLELYFGDFLSVLRFWE